MWYNKTELNVFPKDTNHKISTKQNPCKLERCEQMSIIEEREHKKGITLHWPTSFNLLYHALIIQLN